MENKETENEEEELVIDETHEAPQRWCSVCNKYVNAKGKKKNMCINCSSFTAKFKPEASQEEEEEKKEEKSKTKKREYKLTALRPVNLTGQESAASEVLINAGFAKDFNDLVRRSIDEMYQRRIFFGQLNLNQEQMEKKQEDPNPKKTMQQIQEQEIMSAYAKRLAGETGPNPTKTMRELQEQKMIEAYIENMGKGNQTDPLQFMMLMRMMENTGKGKDSHDNNFMDKIMQLQMIKSLSGDNQVTTLQREIADLKRDMQMQQLIQQSQKGTPLQDQIMALEKIRAERDKEVKEMDVKFQQERDKNLSQVMEARVREIEKQIQQSGGSLNTQRLQEFREELKAIKEMSHELGEREKGAGEYISETIGNVANTLQPTLTRLMEQRERKVPEYMPPPPMFEERQELPEPMPSELTESERQMSDTMSDIYLRKKK